MILISHRGNIDGTNAIMYENSPSYIENTLLLDFIECEIDIWYVNNKLMSGHDCPNFNITLEWLYKYKDRLWIHCKNKEAIEYLYAIDNKIKNWNYFWHQEDTLTITSKGYLWVYPGQQPIKGSIAVLPEIHNDDVSNCLGICTDFVNKYIV